MEDSGDGGARPRVAVTNWVHAAVVDRLAADCEVDANPDTEPWSRAEAQARAAAADGLVAFMPDRVDANFLDACPRLKIVAGALKGHDNFDVEACTRRGVWFTVVPDLLTEPTAELAVGLSIALSRNLLAGDRHVRSGAFAGWRPRFYGIGLAGARIGLMGMGRIGRAIARRMEALGATVVWWDRHPPQASALGDLSGRQVDFDELLATSDFVVVALSLRPETQHLVDAGVLARMRSDAYLINPARGSVVDEAAVADALEAGRLAGYAADVFEMEDWARPDRPARIEPRLIEMPECTVLTPHLGSAVDDVRREIALSAAENVLDVLVRGRPPRHAVNRPAGQRDIGTEDASDGQPDRQSDRTGEC
jgi:phosphonate dehydrogenase